MSKTREGEGGRHVLVWLVAIVIILMGVLYFVVGASKIRQVSVVGTTHYPREEIVAMVGIDKDTTVLDIYMKGAKVAGTLPYVQEVAIEDIGFNRVTLVVTEKEIVSFIPYQNHYLALDKDGYIVGYEDKKVMERPVIEGLMFTSASVGSRLDVADILLSALLDFYHLSEKYGLALDQIRFAEGDGTMIYGHTGHITIIFGNVLNLERKIRDSTAAIEALDKNLKGVLDVQSDTGKYIFKETIDATAYIAMEDGWLAIGDGLKVIKKTQYPMLDTLLITGLVTETPQVGQICVQDGNRQIFLRSLIEACKSSPLPVEKVLLAKGDGTHIQLFSGDLVLDIGTLEGFDRKLLAAKALIAEEAGPVAGYIDLRGEEGTYTIERAETAED